MSQTPFTGKVGQMKQDTKWLASEDFIELGDVKLRIARIYQNTGEVMQDGKKKDFFSVAFEKTDKQLVLNATNRKALAHSFGADTSKWIGHEVFIYAEDGVRAIGGGTTTGLRLRPILAPVFQAPPKQIQPKPAEPEAFELEADTEYPIDSPPLERLEWLTNQAGMKEAELIEILKAFKLIKDGGEITDEIASKVCSDWQSILDHREGGAA